ncbi:MAG TPA: YCF48-related protein [Ignavibacteria bacterium]|mgnify:CR=1 FL=1|nr:YCF48-related protein [Ignavibacteria bacterium]
MKLNLKISTLIFLICFLFQNSYSQQNLNGWFWVNSQPQSNNINWIKILDPAHIYAVGNNGTFMKSEDGGDTWLINTQAGITENLFGSLGTNNLNTAWFFDVNTGIVAGQSVSGDGGKIKRTTDGGTTFNEIDLGLGSGLARVTKITFINATTGYLCGNSVVQAMMTTDAGLSWTQYNNLPNPSASYSSICVLDANNIYLGESSGRKMVKTSDGGASWNEDILPGTTGIDFLDIEFQNINTGYVGGSSNYFAYTTNAGSSWTQAVFPNKNNGVYDLKIVGSRVYALSSYYSYFYTSNLGVTWDSVNFTDPSNVDQPYPFIVTTFDFNGNDVIVSGYNGKINISNDNGGSWRNKNYSVANNEYDYYSVFALKGSQKVWSGANGGLILYSSNRGANWVQQPTTATNAFYEIEMKNSNTGYAIGGNAFAGIGYCYKTTNSGAAWAPLSIPTPNYQINSVSFVDENTGWIVGGLPFNSGSVISKTTNGGLNWTNQTSTPVYNSLYANVSMADANTGYLTGGSSIWKTTNAGTNWNVLSGAPPDSYQAVKIFSTSTAYFANFGQTINKTFDGGVTWTSVSIPSALSNIFAMDWADLYNGIVTGTAGYTAKTSDGGLTWTERNPGSSTIPSVSMIGKDTVFSVCDRNVHGAMFRLYDNISTVTFNTTVGIQGFWNGTTQVRDTVTCRLRNSTAPYGVADISKAYVDNSGFSTFSFNTATSGSYYLEITHRNSIETWSASPITVVSGGTYDYNFTTASSQAYGNNLILRSGKYCDYSGDVNQDGFVNLTDVIQIFNASSVFSSGYIVTDVNGDGIADLTDITFAYNNSTNFVQKVTP